jgi:hypothetical protein
MRNGAYTLATVAAALGIVLLALAEPGAGRYTPLGALLLAVAGVLAGLGKGIDLLGHVRDGATDPEDSS